MIVSLRVVYRWAIRRDLVEINPTSLLDLPNGHQPRDRAASVTEATELIAALPADHQPLKWKDLDLEERLIHVRRSWDRVAGEVAPKSAAGDRLIPIVAPLLEQLTALKETTGREGEQFVFGKHGDRPFVPASVAERAANAWKTVERAARREEAPTVRTDHPPLLPPQLLDLARPRRRLGGPRRPLHGP